MRGLLTMIAVIAWFVHGTFGATFHHSHPGAALCTPQGAPCPHACPGHSHGDHADHSPAGHRHHGHASEHPTHDHGQEGSHDSGAPEHSCPGHHHDDDGSCGFLPTHGSPTLQLLPQFVVFAAAAKARGRTESGARLELDPLPDRGPPLRRHLLFSLLLI